MLVELPVPGTDVVVFQSTRRDRIVFLEEPPPGLVCPICHDVFLEPLMAPCGHSLCKTCVEKVSRNTGACYTCGGPASAEDFFVDNVSVVQIGDLRVYCRNALVAEEQEDGTLRLGIRVEEFGRIACNVNCRLRELGEHERSCDYGQGVCDFYDTEKPEVECGFVCLHKDLATHRRACELRSVRCAYAGVGCIWEGSARHMARHKKECKFHPRPCRNGCGALATVGKAMEAHLKTCPFGLELCGVCDTELEHESCGATVRRCEMLAHRRDKCEYARQDRCRFCTKAVSVRSFGAHQGSCKQSRSPCPNSCGAMVSKGDLQMHLDKFCMRQPVPCPYEPFGCRESVLRAHMGTHLQHNTVQHLGLFTEVLLKLKEETESTNRNIEAQKKASLALVEQQKAQVVEEMARIEGRLKKDMDRMRKDNRDLRTQTADELKVLRAALSDQAATFSAKLLEMFEEFKVLRKEFEEFRAEQENAVKTLEARVTGELEKCRAVVEETRADVARVAGQQHDAIGSALAVAKEERLTLVQRETLRLQADIDNHKWGTNAKLRNLWEHVQEIGRAYI